MAVLNEKQQRMALMVETMRDYWDSYTDQHGYLAYSDQTFTEDALYVIGIALNPEEHKFAGGYRKFQKKLLEMLLEKEWNKEAAEEILKNGSDNL